jgi:hypothetical protein
MWMFGSREVGSKQDMPSHNQDLYCCFHLDIGLTKEHIDNDIKRRMAF